MPETAPLPPSGTDEPAPATPTRSRKAPAKPRTRSTRAKSPTAAEIEQLKAELASVRVELESARREVAEVVAACRDAESRVVAARADAESVRRAVAEVDFSATAVRGLADVARAEVDRSTHAADVCEQRVLRLRDWLAATRDEVAALDAESQRALDCFRAAVAELRSMPPEPAHPPPPPPGAPTPPAEPIAGLPAIDPLPRGEWDEDFDRRRLRLLGDLWAAEREQVGLLQSLADECGDREVREVLEAHAAPGRQRQQAVEARMHELGARPADGRGVFGQIATRLWEAVHPPRDPGDRAVAAVVKALSAAEFVAGLYTAAYTSARLADDPATAELAAASFRDERVRATQLRAALAPAVSRGAHR